MNEKLIVRESKEKDSEAVYKLLRTIAQLHKNGRPDIFSDLISKYTIDQVRERLSAADNGIFIAEYKGDVVGYVFCEVIVEGNGLTLYIDDLCVDEMVRCMGIGKKLLDRASLYAKEKHCRMIMLNVWEFNENAVRFYENYGFSTRSRHLELNI